MGNVGAHLCVRPKKQTNYSQGRTHRFAPTNAENISLFRLLLLENCVPLQNQISAFMCRILAKGKK